MNKVITGFAHIRRYPMETIELILSALLMIWGLLSLLPSYVLPTTSAYGDFYTAKLIFGGIVIYIAFPMLYWRMKHGIHDYTLMYQQKRRKHLFYALIVWLYIAMLRMILAPLYPPFFILYYAFACICFVCYLRLGK